MMRVVCALLVAALAACAPATLPDSEVFIRGTITSSGPGESVMVEAAPGTQYATDRASVRVSRVTDIHYRDGRRASRDALVVGVEVSVWITGVILESDPPQVSARRIVIENSVLR